MYGDIVKKKFKFIYNCKYKMSCSLVIKIAATFHDQNEP